MHKKLITIQEALALISTGAEVWYEEAGQIWTISLNKLIDDTGYQFMYNRYKNAFDIEPLEGHSTFILDVTNKQFFI